MKVVTKAPQSPRTRGARAIRPHDTISRMVVACGYGAAGMMISLGSTVAVVPSARMTTIV